MTLTFGCFLDASNDMEAYARAENLRHAWREWEIASCEERGGHWWVLSGDHPDAEGGVVCEPRAVSLACSACPMDVSDLTGMTDAYCTISGEVGGVTVANGLHDAADEFELPVVVESGVEVTTSMDMIGPEYDVWTIVEAADRWGRPLNTADACPGCLCCPPGLCSLATGSGVHCTAIDPGQGHDSCPCATGTAPTDPGMVYRAALIRVLHEAAWRCGGNDHVDLWNLMQEAEGHVDGRRHNVWDVVLNAAHNAGARDTWPAARIADTLRDLAGRLLAGEQVDTDWRAAADRGRR